MGLAFLDVARSCRCPDSPELESFVGAGEGDSVRSGFIPKTFFLPGFVCGEPNETSPEFRVFSAGTASDCSSFETGVALPEIVS